MTRCEVMTSARLDVAVALTLGHHPRTVCREFGHRLMSLVATTHLEVAWCLRCGEVLQRCAVHNRPPQTGRPSSQRNAVSTQRLKAAFRAADGELKL